MYIYIHNLKIQEYAVIHCQPLINPLTFSAKSLPLGWCGVACLVRGLVASAGFWILCIWGILLTSWWICAFAQAIVAVVIVAVAMAYYLVCLSVRSSVSQADKPSCDFVSFEVYFDTQVSPLITSYIHTYLCTYIFYIQMYMYIVDRFSCCKIQNPGPNKVIHFHTNMVVWCCCCYCKECVSQVNESVCLTISLLPLRNQ